MIVMAGLVPAIHVFGFAKDVDARHKAGHDALYFLFFSCSVMIGLATRKQSTPIGAPQ